eukprot:UN05391
MSFMMSRQKQQNLNKKVSGIWLNYFWERVKGHHLNPLGKRSK